MPLSLPVWYAFVLGVGHALPALDAFWLLTEGLGLRSGFSLAYALTASTLFAFTCVPLSIALFPHFEVMMAGGLVLLSAAVALAHYKRAALYLLLTVMVREDG
ncbi:MAG: hypothetical protein U1E70_11415 [Acetobacteraceae bacterium]